MYLKCDMKECIVVACCIWHAKALIWVEVVGHSMNNVKLSGCLIFFLHFQNRSF
jgi:hypothetical protein